MEMTMTLTQALKEVRVSSKSHDKMDPVLMAHIATAALEEHNRGTRRWMIIGCAVLALLVVGLCIASAREQMNMTPAQQETIARIVN